MLAGVPVHVVHRGNNRQPCFYSDEDRRFYLFHLRRLLPASQCELHAYCLMTNHVHLLLTARAATGCARLMQRLSQLHTQYVNRNYGRTGSLWEGRFRSSLVQSERYVLTCYRYVEMNPVRAGLCATPLKYEWSSHRTNIGGTDDGLVTPHPDFQRLGPTSASRRWAYEQLFAARDEAMQIDEIRKAVNGNFVLGDERFRRTLARALGRRVEPCKAGRPSKVAQLSTGQRELLDGLPAAPGKNVVCP
ncbi:MAG TPA: transposase [Burkholderiales bacterium]